MWGLGIASVNILTVLAEQTPPGSVVVPWWLRIAGIAYFALMVAAFMVAAQSKHPRPWGLIWVLTIILVPIGGAIAYLIAQTLRYRRSGVKHTKGRAETMAPEEYQQHTQHDDDRP